MSLIFCDGFDDGLTVAGKKWSAFEDTNYPTAVAGRNGNGAQFTTSSADWARMVVAAADEHATFICGFALKNTANSSTAATVIEFRSDTDATQHVNLLLNTTGTLAVRRGTTTLATSSQAISLGQWYFIELKATLHDTTGSYGLRVNGVTWLSGSNVDTKNAGTKTVFDTLRIGRPTLTGGGPFVYDDLYLCNGAGSANTDFLGDVAIETLYPNGNGNSSQWVGSDGNSTDNYLLVDEATPDTADYTGSATVGNKDTYGMGNLTRATGAVKGVVATAYAQNTDAGARTMNVVARSSTSESDSAAKTLTTTWEAHHAVYETDPATSAAWTVAGVNAAEFGVKVAS